MVSPFTLFLEFKSNFLLNSSDVIPSLYALCADLVKGPYFPSTPSPFSPNFPM